MPIKDKQLENLFNVEPTPGEMEFIIKRANIERSFPEFLSIEEYLRNFELFRELGLDFEMLKRAEHEIWYQANYNPGEFRKSKIYREFKGTYLIKKYFNLIK